LSAVGVSCGQSVYQGGQIGGLGNTGNSSGPHLHFELSINGAKVNPIDYIQ
jgi:murein DD-endopeptidase MepM/ murein hydrolase activator NlpD